MRIDSVWPYRAGMELQRRLFNSQTCFTESVWIYRPPLLLDMDCSSPQVAFVDPISSRYTHTELFSTWWFRHFNSSAPCCNSISSASSSRATPYSYSSSECTINTSFSHQNLQNANNSCVDIHIINNTKILPKRLYPNLYTMQMNSKHNYEIC